MSIPAPIRASYAFMRMQQYALLAHEACLRQNEAETYAAIQVTLRPGMAAIMASPRAVLRLTPELKQFLGVASSATVAWYARQGDKTHRKHWRKANECFAAMQHPGTRLAYVGNKQRSEWIFQLVFRARNRELVMVPIMFLPQGHNGLTEDQCRVLSVYPFDTERVRSHMQQGKLSPVYRTRYRLGDLRPTALNAHMRRASQAASKLYEVL